MTLFCEGPCVFRLLTTFHVHPELPHTNGGSQWNPSGELLCRHTNAWELCNTFVELGFAHKRVQFHRKRRNWWTQLCMKFSMVTLQMKSQECRGVGTLTLSHVFLFMLSSGCHMPVSVTLRQLRASPVMTMHRHSNVPFLVCVSWYVVVLVLMLMCAFSAFSQRCRQGSERFYQGLLSSVVDGHHYPQGKRCSCLKTNLW